MKRIILAAITCLSLLVALPAVSAAHSSARHAGRDHRPDDRGDHRDRRGDRHDRLEHFRVQPAGTAAVVQSFQNGVLTIKLADGSTASGLVTGDTRLSCEAMNRDFSSHDGGPGSGDNENGGDNGDNGDQNNDSSCVAMLQQPGTTVHDAERRASGGDAVWDRVELGL